jgi:hypothetical protein
MAASCTTWSVYAPLGAGAPAPIQAPGCPLPLVHDVYDGFHVGVPSGWDLSTMGGEISVAPSPGSPEGVLL